MFLFSSVFVSLKNLVLSLLKWGGVTLEVYLEYTDYSEFDLSPGTPVSNLILCHDLNTWSTFAKIIQSTCRSAICAQEDKGLLSLHGGFAKIVQMNWQDKPKPSQNIYTDINTFLLIVRISHKLSYGEIPTFAKIAVLIECPLNLLTDFSFLDTTVFRSGFSKIYVECKCS